MKKDASFTLRMPTIVRDALEEAAQRDMRPAGQYVIRVLVTDLVSKGLLKPGDIGLERHVPTKRNTRKAGA